MDPVLIAKTELSGIESVPQMERFESDLGTMRLVSALEGRDESALRDDENSALNRGFLDASRSGAA